MERVIRMEIIEYLAVNELWDERQHGARAGRSTLTQLLDHQDTILSNLEKGINMDVLDIGHGNLWWPRMLINV